MLLTRPYNNNNLKGQIGTSLIPDRPRKKKKFKKNERWGSAKCICPRCKNSIEKYTKTIDGKKYCVRCFANYNDKVEMESV
jgi:hypothetical protein